MDSKESDKSEHENENLFVLFVGVFLLFFLLGYSLAHLTDADKQEEKRRSEMYKYIGDEKF